MTRFVNFALALSAGVLGGVPALSAPPGTQTAKVYYGDLNLASESGSQTLEKRVERALRRVCGYDRGERHAALRAVSIRCMDATRATLVLPSAALVARR